MYKSEKKSLKQISKITKIPINKIKEILTENNVPIKKMGRGASKKWTQEEIYQLTDYYAKGVPIRQLSELFNCGTFIITNKIKELELPYQHYRFKNFNINSNFFSTIDTEEKAYFLGFVITDGSVRDNQLRFYLKAEDKYIIEKFKRALNSDVKIIEDKRPNKHSYGFEINDRNIVKDLRQYGVIENKTYLMNHICFEKIPDKL